MQQTETQLEDLNELLTRAAKGIGGNDTKLAKTLGVAPQRVSDWRHGRKTCQPEDQALLASLAGLNAIEVLARATVKQHEGTAKGDMLMRALGKSSLAIGAALGSAGASAAAIFSSTEASKLGEWLRAALDTMYRNVKSRKRLRSIKIIA